MGSLPLNTEEMKESQILNVNKANGKREPLSLEEVKAKIAAEEALKSKPVFLTRQQRAVEALKRRKMK